MLIWDVTNIENDFAKKENSFHNTTISDTTTVNDTI